jgi:tRNA nucleotidyltransferase (CCA-adding enzyme)
VRARVARLASAAEARGLPLYLVGGPVRDLLLGRPLRDADLALAAALAAGATEIAREAAQPGDRVVEHPRFGTLRLELADGAAIDVATLRRETYEAPGALPSVAPGALDDDLRRRDFTVNALALALNDAARSASGELVDVADGLAHLALGELHVFHAASFRDDPTRALRAARFAARFGFRLARDARGALRSALRRGAFGAVSGERYAAELEKLFGEASVGGDPARALALLDEWHVLPALEPGLELPRAAGAPLRRISRALVQGGFAGRAWVAGLMVWLAALPTPLARRTLARLAIRGALATRITSFARTRDATLRTLARARGRGAVDALLRALPVEELAALHAWAPRTAQRRIERHAAEDRALRLPVSGDDLLALGLAGPEVGAALARIRAAWLDRELTTRDEALALARELAARTRRRAPKHAAQRRKP